RRARRLADAARTLAAVEGAIGIAGDERSPGRTAARRPAEVRSVAVLAGIDRAVAAEALGGRRRARGRRRRGGRGAQFGHRVIDESVDGRLERIRLPGVRATPRRLGLGDRGGELEVRLREAVAVDGDALRDRLRVALGLVGGLLARRRDLLGIANARPRRAAVDDVPDGVDEGVDLRLDGVGVAVRSETIV